MKRLRAAGALLIVLLQAESAFACPVCFTGAESPMLDAARVGVLVMVGVTLCVLCAFAAWFLRLRRRSAQGELQAGAGPSDTAATAAIPPGGDRA